MLSISSVYAAIAFSTLALAAPSPAPTAHAIHDLRPRFLREAENLPARGIHENGVTTIPLVKKRSTSLAKRQQVPIADSSDQAYGVGLEIGGVPLTFQVDTGSSDLWSKTSDCTTPDFQNCSVNSTAPSYTQSSSFQSLDTPIYIGYGTSAEPTFASGAIGTDNVTFGGITLGQQTFASMNSTNNTIVDSFSGIFGVSFPTNSEIVQTLFAKKVANLSSFTAENLLEAYQSASQQGSTALNRMAASGQLKEPMYTLTLQRTEPTSEGSNAGVMTLGGLPSGVSNDSLTWVKVQPYPSDLVIFGSSLLEGFNIPSTIIEGVKQILPTLPLNWEVPVDGLYINGQLQQNSSDNPEITQSIGLTALFDSGTTNTLLTNNDLNSPLLTSPDSDGYIPCSTSYNLSFGIGGKQFPINPFDLVDLVNYGESQLCTPALEPNDPPAETNTFSYLLGDAFFRSNLVAFYWGNLTDQASDPARIGFLSTTNITQAEAIQSSFWASAGTTYSFPSPTAVAQATTTSVGNPINSAAGVPAASGGVGSPSGGSSKSSSAVQLSAQCISVASLFVGAVLALL